MRDVEVQKRGVEKYMYKLNPERIRVSRKKSVKHFSEIHRKKQGRKSSQQDRVPKFRVTTMKTGFQY